MAMKCWQLVVVLSTLLGFLPIETGAISTSQLDDYYNDYFDANDVFGWEDDINWVPDVEVHNYDYGAGGMDQEEEVLYELNNRHKNSAWPPFFADYDTEKRGGRRSRRSRRSNLGEGGGGSFQHGNIFKRKPLKRAHSGSEQNSKAGHNPKHLRGSGNGNGGKS